MQILLAGGTGLIGQALVPFLEARGHQVRVLSRSQGPYRWDPSTGTMDPQAMQGCQAVINLAGAGIADRPWSPRRKAELIQSRVNSTELLIKQMHALDQPPALMINASAIGYYGHQEGPLPMEEEAGPGQGFLAQCTAAWEGACQGLDPKVRLVKLRLGLVLSAHGGIFPRLTLPIQWGLGNRLGSGKQILSWIHLNDVLGIIDLLLNQEQLEGPFNLVAPQYLSQWEFTQALARYLHRPLWAPAVPAWCLRLALGEMADLVLQGQAVSCKKITTLGGYTFQFRNLEETFPHLIPQP